MCQVYGSMTGKRIITLNSDVIRTDFKYTNDGASVNATVTVTEQ